VGGTCPAPPAGITRIAGPFAESRLRPGTSPDTLTVPEPSATRAAGRDQECFMSAPLSDYAVHLRPQDNIAVVCKPVPAGTKLRFDDSTLTVAAAVRMGHKFAVRPIKEGDPIQKYGQIIGFAARS